MAFQIPAKVQAVFGSQTRAKVLGYLAASSVPQTGYAISKSLEIGPAKVYQELNRLESCGVLIRTQDVRGSKVFRLNDEDLRNFLAKNVRILSTTDWFSPERIAERRKTFEEVRRIPVSVPSRPRRARSVPFADEFRRPVGKDRALNRMRRSANGRR